MPASGLQAGMHLLVVQPLDKSLSPDVAFFTVHPPSLVMTQLGMSRVVMEVAGATLSNARVCVHVNGRGVGPFVQCVPADATPETTAVRPSPAPYPCATPR